jgi:transcriptional regulator with XRE-family HTH domain
MAKAEYTDDKPFMALVLGKRLREARDAKGLTVTQVATMLKESASTTSRKETGELVVRPRDVLSYAQLYGIGAEEIELLTEMAAMSKTRGWWNQYGLNFGTVFPFLVEAELLSTRGGINYWEPLVMPGLLQDEEYTRALFERAQFTEPDENPLPMDEALALRAKRKEILDAERPPEIWAIIGEAAIRTPVGSTKVMARQLQHLLDLCERPNINIQVIPYSSGLHAGLSGPFTTFRFSTDPRNGVAYFENMGSFSDDKATLDRLGRRFNSLHAQGLSLFDAWSYLRKAIAE